MPRSTYQHFAIVSRLSGRAEQLYSVYPSVADSILLLAVGGLPVFTSGLIKI
ncbi:hypothetical protein [Candidatus Vallotiella sp. (ex Adelges kitamiensis)]|uniref:hypothetical protein n=1 Tax=Candidatus Vallotiella sp. (ex Adelges kitamiensis) TaxID=2864217 RepID=UPI001CE2A187|nr:hypothetical protein [Candidatus Vallotia sp. (ex Adelges kitamiensis)]